MKTKDLLKKATSMDPMVDDFIRRLESAIEWENSEERKKYLKELDAKYPLKKESTFRKIIRVFLLIITMPFWLIIKGFLWIIESFS